jgi:hypothetical protein
MDWVPQISLVLRDLGRTTLDVHSSQTDPSDFPTLDE